MSFPKVVVAGLALVAAQAQAGLLNFGDVVQVGNQSGSVFTPSPVAGDANGWYLNTGIVVGSSSRSVYAGQYVMDYSHDLSAGATTWQQFYSFCLEPDVNLQSFSNPYTVTGLSAAGYDADAISELWGRYYGSINNDLSAAAFQIALWELAFESASSTSLSAGAFRLSSTAGAYSLASSWLASLDGTGPRAYNLAVLVDNQGDKYDRQDLIVQIPVPVPATVALFGLGLVGLAASRRSRR
ncbi:MAG: PEP-CTERM sorting domain-containing protein [Permianibacter sp.]